MASRRKGFHDDEEPSAAKTAKMEMVMCDYYDTNPIFEVDIKEEPPAMFNFVDVNNYTDPIENETNTTQISSTQIQKSNNVASMSAKTLQTPVILTPIKASEVKANKPIRIIKNISKVRVPAKAATTKNYPKLKETDVTSVSDSVNELSDSSTVPNKPNIIIQKSFPMVTKSKEVPGNNLGKCAGECHDNSIIVAQIMQTMMKKIDTFRNETERRLTVQNIFINKLINQNEILLKKKSKDDNFINARTELDELLETLKLPQLKSKSDSIKILGESSTVNEQIIQMHPPEVNESSESTNEKIEELTFAISELQKDIRQMRKVLNDIASKNKAAEKYNEQPFLLSLPSKKTRISREECLYKGPISSIVELEKVNKDMLDPKLKEHYIAYLHQKTRIGDQLGKIFFNIMTRECLFKFNYKGFHASGSSRKEALYPTYINWLHALQDAFDLTEEELASAIREICTLNRKRITKMKHTQSIALKSANILTK